ncbi:UDP-glucuronosyl/UDP-glucosyltransferase protein [Dioscorea alata]|uniref:UDP-glucuronosyl/UDP-glucosyltransferase protein n=1 Tax=Dioscorea alata TaxID=55571 RepID=A0ACB7US57_DIOAL|nr:UDP-glucuronosyl/UDP-glucosyltransferase protein [Dioscorea alata]
MIPSLTVMEPKTPQDLHVLFFPFMAPGHMIPMLDIAKLFSHLRVQTTFVTTFGNASLVQTTINHFNSTNSSNPPIKLALLPFPSTEAGLSPGYENAAYITSLDMGANFIKAVTMLRQPFDQLLQQLLPDAILTDSFLPWTLDSALKIGIPRLVFHGTSFFAMCASHSVEQYDPHSRPEESFFVPDIPHSIHLLKSQVSNWKTNPLIMEMMRAMQEAEEKSYGAVMNSFYELEPDYVNHYRNAMGRRVWHVGPVSLCNENIFDMSTRGDKPVIDKDECLNWLDNKKPNSVLYVCFGSVSRFTTTQLHEIALGLESSQQAFIWVVKKELFQDEREELMEEYEKRVEGRGLIIRGWAPQMLILNHDAIGGFLTHCGWNSTLEAVSAGVPMVTMPMLADQFYNERLVVDVLKIGVGVGVKEYGTGQRFGAGIEKVVSVVHGEDIEKAVLRLMTVGEEDEVMRRRARELKVSAKMAIEKGGSSYLDICKLVQELTHKKN